jgi:cell filamentation protein
MSRYSVEDIYCYSGTSVLRNKLDLTDQQELDQFEGEITTLRLVELQENPIAGQFDLAHLKKLHFHIFQDIYDWAGELRTVDISRENSRFAHAQFIESAAKSLFNKLQQEHFLKGLTIDQFALRAAHYLSEINVLHPFREGNGRAQRAFITQLCKEVGYSLDYSDLEQHELFNAMKEAFHGNEQKIAQILKERLSLSS